MPRQLGVDFSGPGSPPHLQSFIHVTRMRDLRLKNAVMFQTLGTVNNLELVAFEDCLPAWYAFIGLAAWKLPRLFVVPLNPQPLCVPPRIVLGKCRMGHTKFLAEFLHCN